MNKLLKNCLCCNSKNLFKSLDLGKQPPANNLIDSIDDEYETYELAVNTCADCKHSQLSVSIDPEILFKHYLWQTGVSKFLVNYFDEFCTYISGYKNFTSKKVLDIASNDGSLLEIFKNRGWDVCGIEPASNLMPVNKEKNLSVINDFFPSEILTTYLDGNKLDLITIFNCFAHVSDPINFLKEVSKLLTDDGICAIQTSQRDTISNGEFDTVYHEHISFFNVFSFEKLCENAGMTLESVQFPNVHGGSYLFIVGKNKEKKFDTNILSEYEKSKNNVLMYDNFQGIFEKKKIECTYYIKDVILDGYEIICVGAPAKGMVLLHSIGVKIQYIIDDSDIKQGKFVPCLGSEIISFDKFSNTKRKSNKVCFIVLAWTLFDEMKAKIDKVMKNSSCEYIVSRLMPEIIEG